jgi:histidinol-phosphate aminotransferase
MTWISLIARPDIVALDSYTCPERDAAFVRLHANELPWRSATDASLAGLNRYPDPQPRELIQALARLYGVDPARTLLTRGIDEGVDLLVRCFCRAGQDAVLVCPPAFVMYGISARIQGASVVEVPLRPEAGFALEPERVLAQCSQAVKLVFLCSPNNPTGNLLSRDAVLRVADALAGTALVIVDEAYVEFSGAPGLVEELRQRPQLVLLRTLSKAYGLAGARCGALLADPEVLGLVRKIIAPFPLTQLSTEAALAALTSDAGARTAERIATVCRERARLSVALASLPRVRRVWPSDANFVLAQFHDAAEALARAREAHLLVRDTRRALEGSLRVTIGSAEENQALLAAWA